MEVKRNAAKRLYDKARGKKYGVLLCTTPDGREIYDRGEKYTVWEPVFFEYIIHLAEKKQFGLLEIIAGHEGFSKNVRANATNILIDPGSFSKKTTGKRKMTTVERLLHDLSYKGCPVKTGNIFKCVGIVEFSRSAVLRLIDNLLTAYKNCLEMGTESRDDDIYIAKDITTALTTLLPLYRGMVAGSTYSGTFGPIILWSRNFTTASHGEIVERSVEDLIDYYKKDRQVCQTLHEKRRLLTKGAFDELSASGKHLPLFVLFSSLPNISEQPPGYEDMIQGTDLNNLKMLVVADNGEMVKRTGMVGDSTPAYLDRTPTARAPAQGDDQPSTSTIKPPPYSEPIAAVGAVGPDILTTVVEPPALFGGRRTMVRKI